ncbi:MAG: RNA polymerase sigma-54 factor [Spartobacteria bacterium]|nr:RNA polymerase sigma-54 factor [Spartobacteria bacterium]
MPYLSQTQSQKQMMTISPQLRQSLNLLQVPLLELQTLIAQELEINPTLEELSKPEDIIELPDAETSDTDRELDFKEEFDSLAQMDDEWREYLQKDRTVKPFTEDDGARREYFMNSVTRPESLQEHLISQLHLTDLSDDDVLIGELIVGNINGDGYLMDSLTELALATGYDPDHMERILAVIQEFDPLGVGAKDLRDCLLIQLSRMGEEDSLAAKVVDGFLPQLAAKKLPDIARALKTTPEEIQKTAQFIATLEPKPGRNYSDEVSTYVLADVTVQLIDDEYVVFLNNEQVPHLRISNHYRSLMENPNTNKATKSYIREKVYAGKFLISSIQQRQDTIFRISTEIVRVQREFLDEGITHLKPLTMAQVAEVMGVHETTVSRAIANKYMSTPRGVFEMKYFFTPGYKTADGQDVSNAAVKDEIQRLVQDENHKKPLSDSALVKKLAEKGYKVARRTIAKYRDQLNIPPSHLRKEY